MSQVLQLLFNYPKTQSYLGILYSSLATLPGTSSPSSVEWLVLKPCPGQLHVLRTQPRTAPATRAVMLRISDKEGEGKRGTGRQGRGVLSSPFLHPEPSAHT